MADRQMGIFRQKTLDRISSPEQLTDYLRVTNPGIWFFLVAVLVLLAGIFCWSAVGTLETTVAARVICENNMARVVPAGAEELVPGMLVRVSGREALIVSTDTDEYGRPYGLVQIDLIDGQFDGVVVTEAVHPISFLLEGR